MSPVTINAAPQPRGKTPLYAHLYFQVIVAITIGILLGHFYPDIGTSMKPLGDAFIKLVKMIIAPVIFLTVSTGIAGMSDLKKVGRVAGKAMLYFLTFSTLALIVGLVVANVVQPGAGMNIDAASLDPKAVATYTQQAHEQSIVGFLTNIIPTTIVGAFASGDILQVLFFSVLFGLSLAMVGEKAEPVTNFLQTLAAPVFKLVAILMKAAPIGAFGAMAFTIGKYGIGSVANLIFLIGTFYLTSLLFVVVILGAVAWYNGFSILALIRYIKEELLLVLGTSSSEAALPTLMAKMRKGRLQEVGGRPGHSNRLFVQSRRHQYLHDPGCTFHCPGNEHAAYSDGPGTAATRRNVELKGGRWHHWRGIHHTGSHIVRRSSGAGCRHGTHPWHRPFHVGMPCAYQSGWQCGRYNRCSTLGR